MKKIIDWLTAIKAPIWVEPIRMAIGVFIVFKGIVFTRNFESFTANIESVGWIFVAAHLAHAIIFIHIVGGILLTLGAATRIMSLINIPILAGAVIFNYLQMLNSNNYMEFEMALVLLAGLILTCIMGGGRFSLDHRMRALDMHMNH